MAPGGGGLPLHGGFVCAAADIWGEIDDLGIWNKNRSRNKIGKITACTDMLTLLPKLDKKSQL